MTKNLTKYLGKQFVHGQDDCYSLLRNFYKDEFDIELTDYARFDGWWNEGLNLYMDHLYEEGFYLLDDLAEPMYGDLYLVALNSPVASHASIYVGNGEVLHHVQGRLSSVDKYRGLWRNFTVCKCRHIKNKNLKNERKTYEFK